MVKLLKVIYLVTGVLGICFLFLAQFVFEQFYSVFMPIALVLFGINSLSHSLYRDKNETSKKKFDLLIGRAMFAVGAIGLIRLVL